MTENEAKFLEKLDELANDLEVDMYSVANLNFFFEESANTIRKLIEENQQYRAMEQRLQKVYGECDGLLETVVHHLENYENIELPDNIIKARLLTDEDVDKWEQLKAIGTIEEFKALKEKSVEKKPIPLDKWGEYHECPVCGKYAENNYGCKYLYCPNCGCKYDWSE